MPTLNIGGQRVKVGDGFMSLSPEQQNATVEEIAESLGGQRPAEKAPIQAEPGPQREKTVGGAATTWLEHGISDLPIVGPAIQTGADYLGTEVIGRLSGQDPSQMREELWKRREERTEDYPASAVSGAVAGNLGAFGGLGATAAGAEALGISGARLLPRAAKSAVTSGSIAATDELVRGGDGFDAAEGAIIGGGIGGAIPIVGAGIRAGLGAVGSRVAPTINAIRDAPDEASRRVGMAVTRDRQAGNVINQADEAVAQTAGVPLINADRGGETTRALARSVANQSPEARGVIERTASDRFAGQGQRAVGFIRRLTGGATDDLAMQDSIRNAARAANRPAYNRAYTAPNAQAMWNEGFEQLMQAPAMQRAARQATTRGANRAAVEGFTPVRNPFQFGPDGRISIRADDGGNRALPNLPFWDQVKRNLDSEIGKAQRAGDRTLSADLTTLRGHLVNMMDQAVPEYRAARQGAAAFFGAEDALEAGRTFVNTPRAIPEAQRAIARFTRPERAAFTTGFASELIDRINSVRDRANVIQQVFGSQAARQQIEMVFGPRGAREIEAYVRVEDLADRLRGAMGNSTTARQLVELGIGAGGGAYLTGDWRGALGGAAVARGARHLGQRIDNRVMEEVARMLTSNNPRALDAAVRRAAADSRFMQAIQTFSGLLAAPARGVAASSGQ